MNGDARSCVDRREFVVGQAERRALADALLRDVVDLESPTEVMNLSTRCG
jgi:hypothetical protein